MSEFVQPNFNRELKGSQQTPYSSDLTAQQRKEAIERALHNTDRWRSLKKLGMSPEEIRKTFDEKHKMRVWSYKGWIDTEMTILQALPPHRLYGDESAQWQYPSLCRRCGLPHI